jgi:hypothetical protein
LGINGMKRIEQMKDLVGGIGLRVGAAWSGLLGRQPAKLARAPAERPAATDPTRVLFPDEKSPSDGAQYDGSHGLGLGTLLDESARAMVRRADELREQKRALMVRMADRAEAEITLSVQALRVVIGLFWFGISAWLFYNAIRGDAGTLPAGMPTGDAFVLSRTFLTIAAAGLGVAFGVVALVRVFGNGDNRKIRHEAEQLGDAIANTSREFDNALTGFRAAMDRRGDPADAVVDLSRAHLTALEASAYFRQLGFLTGGGNDARRLFKGFLSGVKRNPPPAPVFLVGALIGGLFAAAYVYVKYVPKPEPVEPVVLPAIAQYPWALALILFGGALYFIVGLVVSFFGGPIAAGAAAKAREEALDALRGGFTANEAPRPADVVRRIEDAVDVFRARVGGRRESAARHDHIGANQPAPGSASFSPEDSDFTQWRHRDSSLTFVDTGFTTAPKEWRTDAFAKKIAVEEDGKPGSKRRRLSFKKPPGN